MKIIQVMPEFELGGAEIMVETLSYELKKLGCDVIVVSLFNLHTPITDRMEQNGIRVEFFDKKSGLDLSQVRKLYKFFKKEKPDVVHTHRNAIQYGALAACFARVTCKIHTLHSIAEKENGKIQRKFNKILFKYFGVVPVSLSKLIQDSVIDEYGVKAKNTPIILNGMPLEKYNKKTDYEIYGGVKVIHVGRFVEPKNHYGLIKAFKAICKSYPDATLNLFGVGELMEDIKAYVKEEGLEKNVVFNGVSHNIENELIKNDIFCFPSIYEGVPLALIEAMASAMPIVATNVGGISNMLENEIDAFVTDNNTKTISDSIIKLIASKELRETMGANAYNRAKDFSSLNMAKRYMYLYEAKD
ncbi:MAG: glycosyltransferase [Clostridia bacterium]|nr:glycosyltransferase [Clostridia bacterium]